MKTLKIFLIAGALFFIFFPIQVTASIETATMSTIGHSAAGSESANTMLTKLYEIKALRKELGAKKADAD